MGDLETNVFNVKLIEVTIHMKHQTLKVFRPFFSFFNGFDKKRAQYVCFDVRLEVQKHAVGGQLLRA